MKMTIKKVRLKSGSPALRVTTEFDQQMVNWLKKWGNWNSEKKCWYIKEDVEKFPSQAQSFISRWWGGEGEVIVE